jgi:hypothetical protein
MVWKKKWTLRKYWETVPTTLLLR